MGFRDLYFHRQSQRQEGAGCTVGAQFDAREVCP